MEEKTGITEEEKSGAAAAQAAEEQTIRSAVSFVFDKLSSEVPAKEPERKP